MIPKFPNIFWRSLNWIFLSDDDFPVLPSDSFDSLFKAPPVETTVSGSELWALELLKLNLERKKLRRNLKIRNYKKFL